MTQLAEAGFDNPVLRHAAVAGSARDGAPALGPPDLPGDWRLVRECEDESYQWPKRRDVVREDDHNMMLDHALIQSRRRYRA